MSQAQRTDETARQTSDIKKVAAASLIGTTIEWYDFFIYGTAAALVFPALFFPSQDPVTGTLLSFATFGVGFFARPVGGAVFGHFGDRIGRKSMLIATLTMMGLATFAIGILPTYAQIGVLAPVLLTVLRFIQGLGVGGEWGGAVLMAVEHAPPGRRGFYGSWPQMGVPAGLILSNAAFLLLAAMPDESFEAWGWRIPFVFSIVLVAVGLVIRLKIMESPGFAKVKAEKTEAKVPIVEVFKHHAKQVLLAAGAFIIINSYFYILVSYIISYATAPDVGFSRGEVIAVLLFSSAVTFLSIPAWGALSDRVGRRSLYLIGCLGMGVSAFLVFWSVDAGSLLGFAVTHTLALAGFLAMGYGPMAAMYAELFSTRLRYSGASLGYQGGAIFGGALGPIVSVALFDATGTSMSIAIYVCAMAILSFVCMYALTDTRSVDIDADTPLVGSA
ncbi:MFS transporter [Nocardioides sp. GXQ0305]|uniref:MFS transporter n=1 Tax=Nocardioides sp. GXQ0305 TaxID=3423912 RepID=UPI003D7CB732